MDKLWLIIQREYLTRVKKRSFILATILTPLAIVLFMVVVSFILSYESGEVKHIAVLDQANILNKTIGKDEKNLYFHILDENLDSLKANFSKEKYAGILVIPPITNIDASKHKVYYYREDPLGLDVQGGVVDRIKNKLRDYKIKQLGLDEKNLRSLNFDIEFNPQPITNTKEEITSITTIVAVMIGGAMGTIMYITVFIYGMMVMRSVMEEKVNRIVEVMISSVRPFQLMLGKIIGVGAVGLTQVAIWGLLIPLIYLIVGLFFGMNMEAAPMDMEMANTAIDPEELEGMVVLAMQELSRQNWLMIIPLFVLYFLGGYFLYASLFAAVGSAMGDDLGEGQALTIPITIPVLISFYIMMVAVRSPHSSLAVWSSIFPLFSPIVMPARLAFSPPWWQIGLSIVLLLGTAIFMVWLSARIYRVGILMYGKKVTFKEIGKWMFSRG
ncbi:MAG: ABC transporter permease [Saprospiraceae bacterium]